MPRPPSLIDGSTGEGGGQIVRLAIALAAVTMQPIKIINIRANRTRGGGLKAQHLAAIKWLADATAAEVDGLFVGSKTVTFAPRLTPSDLKQRCHTITPESQAASSLLVFQCLLPFLLFASNEADEAIELVIHGGTNVSFSLSWEYLDQVLLPVLESRFGIKVERQLRKRGWSSGPSSLGCIWFKIQPIARGSTLRLQDPDRRYTDRDFTIKSVDATVLVPNHMQTEVQRALVQEIGNVLPEVAIKFVPSEDSGHESRLYILLVAHSESGLRWGRDILYLGSKKNKNKPSLADNISRTVTKALLEEILVKGEVDVYLQDQIVCYQALAEGKSSFSRRGGLDDVDSVAALTNVMSSIELSDRMRMEKTNQPFGHGSLHSKSARWLTAQLLPSVKFFNEGDVVEGVGASTAISNPSVASGL